MNAPELGRFVRYVSKNGDGIISPAVVLRTQAATVTDVAEKWVEGTRGEDNRPHKPPPPDEMLERGFQVELDDEMHVDLLVHGLAGDYREFNVPFVEVVDPAELTGENRERQRALAARSWHWPIGAPEHL